MAILSKEWGLAREDLAGVRGGCMAFAVTFAMTMPGVIAQSTLMVDGLPLSN